MPDYEKEIVELHQYFEDWFTGQLEQTEANAARLADVMADSFHIIADDGRITPRDSLLSGLYGAHGQRSALKIWIEHVVVRQEIDDIAIVTYEEWQTIDDQTSSRVSTVVFRAVESAPNGLVWLHVHESGLRVVTRH